MGKIQQWIVLLVALFLFQACNNIEANHQNNALTSFVDTSIFSIDTIFNQVQIDSQKVSIGLFRAKLDEHRHSFDSSLARPVSLAIFKDSTKQLLYLKTFEAEPDDYPFVVANLFKANNVKLQNVGPLFFSLEKSYGGSGSNYQLFWIQSLDQNFHLLPLYKGIGELSYPYFLKLGNEILVFEAEWNMEQGEAHFSEHRIQITRIDLENKKPVQQFLGKSTNKYFLPDSDLSAKALIVQLKQKEPLFLGLADF
ncbi:MAG: hypothetical protein CFE25_16210 [Chitinophagaceae bacterium BSSC1]|nr:MAG: hypothetical protein CFE25_16210 [Chitinophagaceae bacterium BSSC1]